MKAKRSNGKLFKRSDHEFARSLSDPGIMSILGYTYAASVRMTIPAGAFEDVVLETPPGVKIFFHSRVDQVVGGELEWELRVNPDPGYVAAETFKGNNYDGSGVLSQADIVRTVDPTTGSIFLREGINYPGGAGVTSQSSVAFEESGGVPQFTDASKPLIRFNNVNSASMLIVVNWVWSEVPLDEL